MGRFLEFFSKKLKLDWFNKQLVKVLQLLKNRITTFINLSDIYDKFFLFFLS